MSKNNIHWSSLQSISELDALIELSDSTPCIIFKHSSRCDLSALVQYQLEEKWSFAPDEIQLFLLDVISHRELSILIAERFSAYHASPQLLLIKKGNCTYEASHLDISVEEIAECLPDSPWD